MNKIILYTASRKPVKVAVKMISTRKIKNIKGAGMNLLVRPIGHDADIWVKQVYK